MTARQRTALLAVCLLVVGGCTAQRPADAPAGVPRELAAVDGLAAEHARWVVTEAITGEAPDDGELAARFAGTLLDEDATALRTTLDLVRAGGPWDVTTARSTGSGHTVEVVLRSAGGRYLLLHSTVDTTGRAIVFWFGDALDPALDPTIPVELDRALDGLPARSGVAVGRVQDGVCVDVERSGTRADGALPLASVSKLMILDVVLGQISDGTLSWEQEVEVEERLRSLPAGGLAQAPRGSVVTVEEAVLALLVESDNTAADLLLELVGPASVESVYAQLAEATPATPFWTTRELFELGWGSDRAAGHVPPRGADLDAARSSIAESDLTATVLDVVDPRWQDGLDWFLTPAQACDLGARLHARWELVPSSVRSPAADGHVLLRKPGGAPGVVAGLWLVERPGGPFVVTVQVAAEQQTAVGDAAGVIAIGDALARGVTR